MWNQIRLRSVPAVVLASLVAAGCTDGEGEANHGPDTQVQTDVAPSPDEEAVVAVVLQLFEAMRTNDGDLAASVFHPDARLGRATEEGISFNDVSGFVESIGRPKEAVWDEPIWDWVVNSDGRLAQMWTKYAFYLDDEFSHCGVDALELYRGEEGWQITQLVDTSRRENCWFPPGREG